MDRSKMIEERAIEIEKYGAKTIHATTLPGTGLKDTEIF